MKINIKNIMFLYKMINTEFDPIYANGTSYSVTECFGEDCAKAIEECIEKKQDAYEAALEAQEEQLKQAAIDGTTYAEWFNLPVEPAEFGGETAEELKEMIERGLGNVALDNDMELAEPLQIATGSSEINLNGKTMKNPNITGATDVMIISGDAKITLSGNGNVEATDGGDGYAVIVRENAELTIEGGVYTSGSDAQGKGNAIIYGRDNAKIIVTGGEFIPQGLGEFGYNYNLNLRDADRATASIIAMGGRYKNFNPANCGSETIPTNFVPEGYTVMCEGIENLEFWTKEMGDKWYEVVKK